MLFVHKLYKTSGTCGLIIPAMSFLKVSTSAQYLCCEALNGEKILSKAFTDVL